LQDDLFGTTETNINWNNILRDEARSQCHQHYKTVIISTYSRIEPTKTSYQPGGTATVITDKWTGRSTKQIKDTSGLGRWSGFQLQRNNPNEYFNIITAYRPTILNGIHTCYQQQTSILKQKGTQNPDPRQQILNDLAQIIQNYNNNIDITIVLIDANESLFQNNSKISLFLAETGLVPLIQNSVHYPPTHSRGTHCIDFIFGSPIILEYITNSGITPIYEQPIPLTDHRDLFVDIQCLGLFGATVTTLIPQSPKRITSLSNPLILRFISNLEQEKAFQNIYITLQQLYINTFWTDIQHDLLELIDEQLTTILLQAEQKSATITLYPWSPSLHNASLLYTYWLIHLKGRKNNINTDYQLTHIKSQLQDNDSDQGNPNRSPLHQL
jgi:hypothetical protein